MITIKHTYKGYMGKAYWDYDVQKFHGKIEGIRPMIPYSAESFDGLQPAFEEAVEDYLLMSYLGTLFNVD